MIKNNYLLFLFFLIAQHSTAQGFQKLYGGHYDESGIHSALGYYSIYTVGTTFSSGAGSSDIALWKTDLSGNVMWVSTYGGTYAEDGSYMTGTGADGGFAIVGSSRSFNASQNQELLFFKTNSYGNIAWQKTFAASTQTVPGTLIRTSDDGFAMTGFCMVNGLMTTILIRTNANGDTLFTCLYGTGTGNDQGVGLMQTPDGGFMIVGKTTSSNPPLADMMVIKTDASGNMKWAKSYGYTAWDEAEGITMSYDGNYLICGATTGYGAGSYDILLWKCDTAGNYLWGRTYGGSKTDASYSVIQNVDGSIVIGGYTNSMGYGHALGQDTVSNSRGDDSTNIFLMKTNSIGDTIWTEAYGNSKMDEAVHFIHMTDGGYIIPGWSNSYTNATDSLQMLLIRTDSLGYSNCQERRARPIIGTASYVSQTLPLIQSRGMVVNNSNLSVIPWNIAADDACQYIGISSPLALNESLLSVMPNPCRGRFTIHSSIVNGKVEIFNVLGENIYFGVLKNESIGLNAVPGIYFVQVSDGERVYSQRLVIEQ